MALMILPIKKHQTLPDNGKDKPRIPRRLRKLVTVRLQNLPECLGARDEYGGCASEEGVTDEVGVRPGADPGDVGLGWISGEKLAEGLAEEEVVVLGLGVRNGCSLFGYEWGSRV